MNNVLRLCGLAKGDIEVNDRDRDTKGGYTPGPWKAGEPQWRRYGPPYKIPISGPHGTIANVLTHESIQWYPLEQRDPQPNANAKLIAEAPEMFQVIKRLAEPGWFGESELKMLIQECRRIVQKLDANSKARG